MEEDIISRRAREVDYVESQVEKIFFDLKDCLTGRVQKPDFLYVKSKEHCISHGEVLLMGRLSNYGIEVRVCDDSYIPNGDKICVYDLDKAEWVKSW